VAKRVQNNNKKDRHEHFIAFFEVWMHHFREAAVEGRLLMEAFASMRCLIRD
jgi:hypothetical protein